MQEARAALADTFNRVRRGELDFRIGNCLGMLAGQILKAVEKADIEARLAAVEAALAEGRTP
jgi:hypothetical protein